MTASKAELRRLVRSAEAELSEECRLRADEAIAERLISLPEYRSARRIMLFCGVGREPDTRPLIEHALAGGKLVALPRITGRGVMEAAETRAIRELVTGAFGIPEPPAQRESVPPEELDLIVVPAAAFTVRGERLGRGGGYYDRFLLKTRGFTVGFARETNVLDLIPTEPHDISVDCLITESRTIRCK